MKKKKIGLVMLIFMMMLVLFSGNVMAKRSAISATSKKIYIGKTIRLKVKTSKKVKWNSSNKSVAKVSSRGNVRGIKAGKAVITAKVGNKKWRCKVEVKPYSISQMKSVINKYFNTHKIWRGCYVSSDFKPRKKGGKYVYCIRSRNGWVANVLIGFMEVDYKTGKGKLAADRTYSFSFI